jgi:biotin transporter BioY
MFYTGRRNNSRILMLLFTLWVGSPFVAAALADRISKAWSVTTRATLYGAMLVLSLGSLVVYAADASMAIRGKAAFVFLVVPPTSSLLAAAAVAIAALMSARLARRGVR